MWGKGLVMAAAAAASLGAAGVGGSAGANGADGAGVSLRGSMGFPRGRSFRAVPPWAEVGEPRRRGAAGGAAGGAAAGGTAQATVEVVEEPKPWHAVEAEAEQARFRAWLAEEEAERERERAARQRLVQQGHPEDPDPLQGALGFSRADPLIDPALAAGFNNLDNWPRSPAVWVEVRGVRHLAGRALRLLVVLNEASSWTVELPAERAGGGSRAAMVQLPDVDVGANYVAVSALLPDAALAGGRRREVLLGVAGVVFVLERWRYKDAWVSELLGARVVHSDASVQVCATCRRTIHASLHLCARQEDQDAMAAADARLPSFRANRLKLAPASGWARHC